MSSKVRSIQREIKRKAVKDGVVPVTLGQLLQSIGALNYLTAQALAASVSFRIGRMLKAINGELEQYELSRKTLCERFSNKNAEGKAIMLNAKNEPIEEGQQGRYDIPKEKMEEFEKELTELSAVEVELPGQQIHVSDLGSVNIAPAHLMILDWMIAE